MVRDLLSEPVNNSTTLTFPNDTDSFWKDSTLLTYLEQEEKDIANEISDADENFFVTQTSIDIVANTREYALPSDFRKMVRCEELQGSNTTPLSPIAFNDKENYGYQDLSATDNICGYYIKGNYIGFSPEPQQTEASGVRLHYIQCVPDFDRSAIISSSLESIIPKEHRELLVWGAVKRAMFQQESTGEQYMAALNEYNKRVTNLKKWIEDRQIQRPRRVKRRRYR